MCKAQEYVNTLIDILQDIKQSYEFNLLNITDCDNNEQDLLHEMELAKFNVVRGYYLSKEMQRVRKERRAWYIL